MEAPAPAVATAFQLITLGSRDDLAAACARAGGASVDGLLLRAAVAWCDGDLRRAEASLRAACAAAPPAEHPYALDALGTLLVACGRYARAAALLAHAWPDRALEAAGSR